MDNKLILEKQILLDKREKILEEIKSKKINQTIIGQKLKMLTKEAKGSYSEDKETTEKIYNLLNNDIEEYNQALKNPYFGRVDFKEKLYDKETIYIGKKGISSHKDGEEIIVDWRAPVADLYYSGTGGEAFYKAPSGIIEGDLTLKRKFLFNEEELLDIFDDKINELIINEEEGVELVDEFLKINLEESRGNKLKEVVATIQKEQNDIIRWPKALPLIVQGTAGTGKTTIALHRLAYLLYRYNGSVKGKDILVLAPNKLFLDYISEILPDLGVDEVHQTTYSEYLIKKLRLKGKLYNKDKKLQDIIEESDEKKKKDIMNIAKIKGTLSFKKVIDRYISILESSSLEVETIKIKGYTLFGKREIMRLYLKDLTSYPINKRKDEIKRYLNLKLKERITSLIINIDTEWDPIIKGIKDEDIEKEEKREKLVKAYDERDSIKDYIKTNAKREINDYFRRWRGINAKDIYLNLYMDEGIFELVTDNLINKELINQLKEITVENINNGIIDEDDLSALMYINILLEGIPEKEKFKHIVVDEAQDYSPFQIAIIKELVVGESITLVGDLAQGIYSYKGIVKWSEIIEEVFKGNSTYLQLTQSYRSTVEIIELANSALKSQMLEVKPATPVLRHGQVPKVIKFDEKKELIGSINNIIDYTLNKGKTSIAIITKSLKEGKELEKVLRNKTKYKFKVMQGNENSMDSQYIIIPSYLTKGLEYDTTIIYNPTNDKYNKTALDTKLLYVSLTRALHDEFILLKDEINNMTKQLELKDSNYYL